MLCIEAAHSVWVTRAVSFAKRRSWISVSCNLVWAWRRCRLKRLPSRWYLTYTPSSSSKSSVACLSIMPKKMLKKVSARTQPCFTPLEMGQGSDRSPWSLIWPHWFSCSWNLGRQPMSFQNEPKTCPAHRAKCFCKVNKISIEFLVLFSALLLKLAEDEHHVHRASVSSEAALALGKDFFSNGWNEPVEQDPGKHFASDGK